MSTKQPTTTETETTNAPLPRRAGLLSSMTPADRAIEKLRITLTLANGCAKAAFEQLTPAREIPDSWPGVPDETWTELERELARAPTDEDREQFTASVRAGLACMLEEPYRPKVEPRPYLPEPGTYEVLDAAVITATVAELGYRQAPMELQAAVLALYGGCAIMTRQDSGRANYPPQDDDDPIKEALHKHVEQLTRALVDALATNRRLEKRLERQRKAWAEVQDDLLATGRCTKSKAELEQKVQALTARLEAREVV